MSADLLFWAWLSSCSRLWSHHEGICAHYEHATCFWISLSWQMGISKAFASAWAVIIYPIGQLQFWIWKRSHEDYESFSSPYSREPQTMYSSSVSLGNLECVEFCCSFKWNIGIEHFMILNVFILLTLRRGEGLWHWPHFRQAESCFKPGL